jgi:hypothetical protein
MFCGVMRSARRLFLLQLAGRASVGARRRQRPSLTVGWHFLLVTIQKKWGLSQAALAGPLVPPVLADLAAAWTRCMRAGDERSRAVWRVWFPASSPAQRLTLTLGASPGLSA